MNTNICGNCEYCLKTATATLMCVKHRIYVTEDTDACNSYFNYRKTQIYNKILNTLGGKTNDKR